MGFFRVGVGVLVLGGIWFWGYREFEIVLVFENYREGGDGFCIMSFNIYIVLFISLFI